MRIEFTVQGESRPAGSKTAVPVWDKKRGDYLRGPEGRIVTRVFEPKTKTKESVKVYRERVAAVAREHYDGPLLDGPLALWLRFYRSRPQGHYGTGRNAGKVKPGAPPYPATQPDCTKLLRAIEDALTKVIWTDDARIVRQRVSKDWGTHYYVEVTIETLETE